MLGTNTDANTGTQRRRRTRRIVTPEETLARLREENPGADAAKLREAARQYLLEKSEFKDQASRDFNFWCVEKTLFREIKEPKPEPAQEIAAQRIALKEQITRTMAQNHEKIIEAEVAIRLLEYQTTYGKLLGDCTGAECERLSRRYGDFFFELAKRLNRSETVRAHLTEVELQAIARTHRLIGEKAAR